MSIILGRIFASRKKIVNATTMKKSVDVEGQNVQKHVAEHEIVDQNYHHDHKPLHTNHQDHKDYRVEANLSKIKTTTPSFMLYLWASLPILLLSFSLQRVIILLVVTVVLINFLIIQMRVHTSKRYVASGIVSFMALAIYLAIS